MSREREITVFVPVAGLPPGGLGGVGAIFAIFGGVVVFAILVAVAVTLAYPTPVHQAVTPSTCAPFCAPTTAGGAR